MPVELAVPTKLCHGAFLLSENINLCDRNVKTFKRGKVYDFCHTFQRYNLNYKTSKWNMPVLDFISFLFCWTTSWMRVHIENLMFPAIYETRHWTLSWARWIQSTPSRPISLKSTLILSPIYAYIPKEVFSLEVYQQRILYFSFPHSCYLPCQPHHPWVHNPNDIRCVNCGACVLGVMPFCSSLQTGLCHLWALWLQLTRHTSSPPSILFPFHQIPCFVLRFCVCVCVCHENQSCRLLSLPL
jgi:hypothetical protein